MIQLLTRRWHRLWQPRLRDPGPLRPGPLREDDPTFRRLADTAPLLERILRESIIPFWMSDAIDVENGGFRLHHDVDGSWKGPTDKHCIPQARMVWFLSRAFRAGFLPEGLDAARRGAAFLRDRLWDPAGGGFFWSVSHDGRTVTDDSKRLYAQCFGLYGLSEYALASGDPEAASHADEVVAVLREHFRDRRFGGFVSELDARMRPAPTDGPRGESVLHKTVNEHLHVLEALAAHARVRSDPWVVDRLRELVLILTGTALRKSVGTVSDRHRADWTPLLRNGQSEVSYGHDAECVWLVAEACTLVGLPFTLVADWARSVLDVILRWGRDRRRGGIYFTGPLGGPAHTRRKVWWTQAEVLVGGLAAHRLTGDQRYADLYLDTLEWIVERHVVWDGGDWRATIEEDGRVTGDRAGLWKTPYHNGRAMIQCLELLSPGEPFAEG
jgi:mannobiose 2-epimerase